MNQSYSKNVIRGRRVAESPVHRPCCAQESGNTEGDSMKINLGVGAKIAVVIRTAIHLVLPSFSSAQTRSIPRLVLDTRRNRATFTCAVETKSKDSNARETRSRMNPQMKSSMGHVNGVDAVTSEVVLCVNKLAAAVAGHARRRAEVIPTSASSENGNAPITRLSRWFICLLCVILLATTALPQTQQTVVVPGDKVTKTVWVAAAQYNVQNKKDYGSIVLAASMNAFYKTYPNATPAQTQDVVTAIQSRLSGLPKTDYVFAHQ